jgi:hypothetical protein
MTRRGDLHRPEVAQLAAVSDSSDLIHNRLEARAHALHEKDVLVSRARDECFELGSVGGDGFLADDVFSCVDGEEDGVVVFWDVCPWSARLA